MVGDFRHACVLVRDLDRSLKFYRDLLGLLPGKILTIEGKYPEKVLGIKGVKLTYAKLSAPNQSRQSEPIFELHCWKKPRLLPKKSYNHISFTVKNLDSEYKRLRKSGVKFISSPLKTPYNNRKLCFAFDPDNNLIEFIEG